MVDGHGWRAQDKDKDEVKETNVLLKEMELLSTKMDNIEKQFSSKTKSRDWIHLKKKIRQLASKPLINWTPMCRL